MTDENEERESGIDCDEYNQRYMKSTRFAYKSQKKSGVFIARLYTIKPDSFEDQLVDEWQYNYSEPGCIFDPM